MNPFKKYNSNLIAAIGTLIVYALAFGVLSYNFSGNGDSSQLSDADLDQLELNLEDFSPEILEENAPGKDPLTEKNDNASESISKEKGSTKTTQSIPAPVPEIEEVREVIESDTLIPPKKVIVELLKIDTAKKVIPNDSAILAQITKSETNKTINENYKLRQQKERERFEYYKKNYRMINNFKKVYPYVLKTREIMDDLNAQLAFMKTESEKKKLISQTEKILFDEYENAVLTMSINQGKLLLKLLARETNKTGYEIIKEYKGAFSATFWYGVGKIFGTDIKTEFKAQQDTLIIDMLDKYKNNELY